MPARRIAGSTRYEPLQAHFTLVDHGLDLLKGVHYVGQVLALINLDLDCFLRAKVALATEVAQIKPSALDWLNLLNVHDHNAPPLCGGVRVALGNIEIKLTLFTLVAHECELRGMLHKITLESLTV